MNLNLIHPEMNICSYGDCTTAFCVIVIGGDIYCKRHAIDALCGVELAALRARVGELEQERDELRDALKSRLQKILSDDRINYPPASVMINAPLALIQVNLDTEKEILEWAISLLDAALAKGAK